MDIIKHHNKSDPMFLVVSYDLPHFPVESPERYQERYNYVKDDTRRPYLGLLLAMTINHFSVTNRHIFSHSSCPGMVSMLDEAVGGVIDALKERQMLDDTILVFMSDVSHLSYAIIDLFLFT